MTGILEVVSDPSFASLTGVERGLLCGLLDEHGTPRWDATYEHPWLRAQATWRGVADALALAVTGAAVAAPRDQPPGWLDRLVRDRISDLGHRWDQSDAFGLIRLLERLELVDQEPDDAYVLAMISGLGDRRAIISRADLLRADPDLRDRLWRVFEVEGGGEVSLANIDKFSAPAASWRATFLELVEDGTLDRGRVLECCLEALQRDFSAYRAGWFSALYRALAPTPAELEDHQSRYRELLRSPVTATVSLAAKMLREVSTSGALDDTEVGALVPGLLVRTKGPALDILRVLNSVRVGRPDLASEVGAVAAAALEHPDTDVQRAAVKLLTAVGARATAKDFADGLALIVQAELGVQPQTVPTPLVVTAPRGTTSVVPVRGGDLLERTAALLEDASDPIELELVLAALARLDDPTMLRPLAKRARTVWERGPRDGVIAGWLRGHLARLVLLADGTPLATLPTPSARTQFLAHRMDLVAAILTGRSHPTVLLATPTSSDGWLEPAVLLARLNANRTAPHTPDLVAALLRLAPDGREEALLTITRDDEIGEVLRHALGGPPPPRPRWRIGRMKLFTPELWVAASRTRDPSGEDLLLLNAGLDAAGQGRPVAPVLSTSSRPYTWRDNRGEHQGTHWRFGVHVPHGAAAEDPAQPTVATSYDSHPARGGDLEDWIGWLAVISPHDVEAVMTELCWPVLQGWGVMHDATRVLGVLASHAGHLGALAAATLAGGLAADRVDHRVLAVDAILVQAAAGRLSVDALAAAMALVAKTCQAPRWAGSLAQLVNAEGGAFVGDVLTRLLPTLDRDPRGIHSLLELLIDDRLRRGTPTMDTTLRAWLEGFAGSSRAARAARQLLAR